MRRQGLRTALCCYTVFLSIHYRDDLRHYYRKAQFSQHIADGCDSPLNVLQVLLPKAALFGHFQTYSRCFLSRTRGCVSNYDMCMLYVLQEVLWPNNETNAPACGIE